MIQNLVDGKLVELPDVHQDTETRVDGESESQLEDVICHYEQELVRHLETQRRYFDQELRKAAATSVEAEQLTRSVQKKYTQLQTKHTAIEGEVEFLKQVNESLTSKSLGTTAVYSSMSQIRKSNWQTVMSGLQT